jgi:methoxymalonate biosynthesis protein
MSPSPPPVPRLAVLGAGTMGTGITALALGHGLPVELIDIDAEALRTAPQRVQHALRTARLMGTLPDGAQEGELSTAETLAAAAGASAVVEAVTERTEDKAKALAEAAAAAPGAPLVTNTSGIPIDELAEHVPRPDNLLGTHFMNPPYAITTVEVVQGPRSAEAAMSAWHAVLQALGRRPVVVGAAPGFVTRRLLHPMINAAARIVQDGTAEIEAVDTLMQGCLGHPTGPLRTADLIGLDNLLDSLWALHARTGEEACRPCDLLQRMVRDGDHGRKSGRGFYTYAETEMPT